MAGICRLPIKPLPNFTQFITGALEYPNNYRTVFAGDFNVVVMSLFYMARNYADDFHQYSLVNEINIPFCASPIYGNVNSRNDYLSHNLNSLICSNVVSPTFSDHYDVCVNFKVKHEILLKKSVSGKLIQNVLLQVLILIFSFASKQTQIP